MQLHRTWHQFRLWFARKSLPRVNEPARRARKLSFDRLEERTLLALLTPQVVDIGNRIQAVGDVVTVGQTIYFQGYDTGSSVGVELYKTDLNSFQATLVKDVAPGANGSLIQHLTNVNGTLFFDAFSTPGGNRQLWKSDGTSAGTTLVYDGIAHPSELLSSTAWLAVNNTLFFAADTAQGGSELWKSDGTSIGTKLIKNINTSGGSYPDAFAEVNGTLYFRASDGVHGNELWKSNGTSIGTVMVKDIEAGAGDSNPESLTNVNGTLYFDARTSATGFELWKSNGTSSGTAMVKDIFAGATGGYAQRLTNVSGSLYFMAETAANGAELWKSNGTSTGTFLVKDINSGSDSGFPTYLANVNGRLFFSATTTIANDFELWTTDGTSAGTTKVKEINSAGNARVGYLTNVNGVLFFVADDGVTGRAIWASSDIVGGTKLVADIYLGVDSPYVSAVKTLTNANGTLLFAGDDGTHAGYQLYKSNGSSAGTMPVRDTFASNAANFTDVSGVAFFTADDGTHGTELWKRDSSGVTLVKDINTFGGSSPKYLTNVNGTLYFQANDASTGGELWKSDGTSTGTVLVKDIAPGTNGGDPSVLTNVNGTLYFRGNDGSTGRELWKSNGTSTGTVLVKDIDPGNSESVPRYLTNVNGTLYFPARDGSTGYELWKSDGTSAGTVLVKDIHPGASGSSPFSLTNVNGKLYFQASDGSTGVELWKSDGTSAGTVLVKDIRPGASGAYPYSLTNVNGTLYFRANDGSTGNELWKSDGTSAGTVLVKDLRPGGSAYPGFLTNVNGTLFFQAGDGSTGYELWKSDGTSTGTVLVKDIAPGNSGSVPRYFTNVNGTLYFAARDGSNGYELWKSDGTSAGTVLVKDISPGSSDAYPRFLTNVNGTLYFQANDGTTGSELWTAEPPIRTVGNTVYVSGDVNYTAKFVVFDQADPNKYTITVDTQANPPTANRTSQVFSTVLYPNIVVDGGGGNDFLNIVTSTLPETASLSGRNGRVLRTLQGSATAYSLSFSNVVTSNLYGGANDIASFSDPGTSNAFYQVPLAGNYSTMAPFAYKVVNNRPTGDGFQNEVIGFTKVNGFGAGKDDYLFLFGDANNNTLIASPTLASWTVNGVQYAGSNIYTVTADGKTGVDNVTYTGTTATDAYTGFSDHSVISSSSAIHNYNGFELTIVNSGGGSDTAVMYGSTGNDTFTATNNTSVEYKGTNFDNIANGFNAIFAHSDPLVTGGARGSDTATVINSNQNYLSSNSSIALSGAGDTTTSVKIGTSSKSNILITMYGFALVQLNDTNSVAHTSIATIFDSTGNDRLLAGPSGALFTWREFATGSQQVSLSGLGLNAINVNFVNGGNNTFARIGSFNYTVTPSGTYQA